LVNGGPTLTVSVDWALALFWLSWAGYWAQAAARSRSPERAESRPSRLIHLLLVGLAFLLLFLEPLRIGILGRRVVPAGLAFYGFGLCLVALGLTLSMWARVHLGEQWSGAVAIRRDHRLVETGPYAFIRHPIYTGLLVALVGSAMAVGAFGAALAVPIAGFAYFRKMRIEEAWLIEEFGTLYQSYSRRVGALLPLRSLRVSLRDSIARSRRQLLDPAELDATIERLHTSGRLSEDRAALLRQQLPDLISRSAYVLRNLAAHLAIGVIFAFDLIPLPLGTIGRVLWVAGNRAYESAFGSRERAQVHSFKVLLVAAIPWLGYAAYLLPLRRESAEAAFLYAHHLSFSLNGVSFDEFLATKPRILQRAGEWLIPPMS
jgi:protein-S-isoprenylcysteine O-methyltransferase Ste14